MSTLPDQLEIKPLTGPFNVTIDDQPGSKSLTNRALLLAALAQGESTLANVLISDDTRVMLAALGKLGFKLDINEAAKTVRVQGYHGKIPNRNAELFLGNAGTAMRFLASACCLSTPERYGGEYHLDGIERMRHRPIGQLVDSLNEIGGGIDYVGETGYPPLLVHGNGLRGGKIRMSTTLSSQYISALLQIGPCCDESLTIYFDGPVTSRPYVEMTLTLMERFGASVDANVSFTAIRVEPSGYEACSCDIEPDASNAGYFLAMAAIVPDSRCTIERLGFKSLQGDAAFAEQVIQPMGASVIYEPNSITVISPPTAEKLTGIDADLNHMPDMAQTLAVTALFAEGPTTIRNVGNLRVKETDRLAALQTELTKLGATVMINGDDITIKPPPGNKLKPATIDTYDDHRMAMSFAIAGLRAPGVIINNPSCVNKTFPGFFGYLHRLEPRA